MKRHVKINIYNGYDIIIAININNMINGNNTKNHAITGAPALQIKFKIHVQKIIYTNFITNNIVVLVTLHEYIPKQYTFSYP